MFLDEDAGSDAWEELANYLREEAGSGVAAAAELRDVEKWDDSWLTAARYSPNGAKVCLETANEGTCQRFKKFGKSKNSHDPENIKMFKTAQTLGKNDFQRIAGTRLAVS